LGARHRQTAMRRTSDYRSRTTGIRRLAVSRRGLVGGSYRPEAIVGDLLRICSPGLL